MALDARILLSGVAPKALNFNDALTTFSNAYNIASTLKNKRDYGTIAQLFGQRGEGFNNPDTLKQAYDINPTVTDKFVAMKAKQDQLALDAVDRKIRMQETANKGRYYKAQEDKIQRETDEAERVNSAKPFQAINDSLHGMARSGTDAKHITASLRDPLENLLIEHAYRSVNDTDPETGEPMAKPQGTLSLSELDKLGNPNDWNAQDINTITGMYGSNAMAPDKRQALAIQQQQADSNRANVNSQINDRNYDNQMDRAELQQRGAIANAQMGLKRDEINNTNQQAGLNRQQQITLEDKKQRNKDMFEAKKQVVKLDQNNQEMMTTVNGMKMLRDFTVKRDGFSVMETMPLMRGIAEKLGIKTEGIASIEPLVAQIASKLTRATDSQPTQMLIEQFRASILDPRADKNVIVNNLNRMIDALETDMFHNKYIINQVNQGKTVPEALSTTEMRSLPNGQSIRLYDSGETTQSGAKVYYDKSNMPYVIDLNGNVRQMVRKQ